MMAHFERHPNRVSHAHGISYLAEATRLPETAILAATKGQPFRRDFGRDRRGKPIVFFWPMADVAKWAKVWKTVRK